jgi:ABC-type transport system substrate-binding protein
MKKSSVLILVALAAAISLSIAATSIISVQRAVAQPPGSTNAAETPGSDPNQANPGNDEGLKQGWKPIPK